jgi:hypothetical protein
MLGHAGSCSAMQAMMKYAVQCRFILDPCHATLYHAMLRHAMLYRGVLCMLFCSVLCCAMLFCSALCCAMLYCSALCCDKLYCSALCCDKLYCTALCCVMLYCSVMYYAMLYCSVLCCTKLYCSVLSCAVPCCTEPNFPSEKKFTLSFVFFLPDNIWVSSTNLAKCYKSLLLLSLLEWSTLSLSIGFLPHP